MATDLQGNQTWKRHVQSHQYNPTIPQTWIDRPVAEFPKKVPFRLWGHAADNTEVGRVQICFRDLDNDKYWDGENWVDGFHFMNAKLEPDPDRNEKFKVFSITYDAPVKGRVVVSARAVDPEENSDQTVVTRTLLPEVLEKHQAESSK